MIIAVNTRFLMKDRLEGIGRFTYEIVKRMVVDHPEDQFYFLFDRAFDESFIFAENVFPIVVNPPARHPILWYMWFEMAVPKVLKKIKADVFLSPDSYCSLATDVKTAMVLHDIGFEHFPEQIPFIARKYYRYFTPKYAKKADHIIAVSEFTKNDVASYYKINSKKISVVYNAGIDLFVKRTTGEISKIKNEHSKGVDYFFYLGAIHERKNVHGLIKAFSKFKEKTDSKIKLLFAGRFLWEVGEIKSAFDESHYKKDIQFLDFVSDEKAAELMSGAKAFVFPSFYEGFGIPIVEAMKCGIPIITSTASALPEIAGDAAILIDPNSVDELASAMKKVAEDKSLIEELSKKSQERAKVFSWDKSAKQVYTVLKNL